MANLCTSFARHNAGGGCKHSQAVISLLGQSYTIQISEAELDDLPIDYELLCRQLIKIMRDKGVSLDALAGRVCLGEEATNVKVYSIISKDVTRTNVGTAYRDVPNGASGERKFIDLTGCTEFRPRLWANLVGTGPFQFRIIRDGDSAVFYESPSITQTGERELDPGWAAIPVEFDGETLVRLQIKSAVAADDPVVRGCDLGVR